jgi:heme-degrading monooxygenase HmoA
VGPARCGESGDDGDPRARPATCPAGGREEAYEAAFARARPIIAATPGFRRLTLSRCLERPSTYLLLVEWDRFEDHIERFRGSAGYRRWRELLHPFYDEHFGRVLEAVPADGGQQR